MADDTYMNNPNLRPALAERTYTVDDLKEILKCKEDIIYFAENYCVIVSLDGKQIVKLYPYQKELLLQLLHGDPENDKYNNVILSPRQSGKCLSGEHTITIRNKHTKEITKVRLDDLI